MFKEELVQKFIVELTMPDGAKPIGFNVFGDRNDARAFAEDVVTKNKAQGIRAFIRVWEGMEVVYDSTKDQISSSDTPDSLQ